MTVTAQRYPSETESEYFDFTLEIIPCVNILSNSETTYEHDYYIGDPMLQLELVENEVNDCTNSHYTIVYGDNDESPPGAFNVYNMTDFRQMNITFEVGSVEELSPGTYTVEVWEEDWYTGFTAKTVFNLNLYEELAPFAGLNFNTTV